MAITCRDIISDGLRLGRVVGIGRTPRASEAAEGLKVLQGMYDGFVVNGMFGRLTDVFTDEDYTANEWERIYNDGATITIPTTITNDGDERAPYDLSCIVVMASGVPTNRVYSGGAWRTLSDLTLDSDAPFSERDRTGLAALFALYYTEAFGSQLSPMWAKRGLQFQGSLSYKIGSTQPVSEGVYY